ncbi:MAG: Gfo/Idh/MocA family protein [Planctomycetota bacterium]|jgi:predicted dehydrogenase
MGKVKVGCVGVGFMGKMHFGVYKEHPSAKVVAIADVDEAKLSGDWSKIGGNIDDPSAKNVDLAGIKKYKDALELINDPDVELVDITLPTFLHAKYVIDALKAGKHVLVEKPIALTVADADKCVEAAKRAKGKFMIAHCIRFWPEYEYLAQLVRGKKYGRVRSAVFKRRSIAPVWGWQNWLMNAKRSGGAVMDLHVHDTDYIYYIFKAPKKVESAGVTGPSGGIDHIITNFDYGKNMLVTAEGGWVFHGSYPFEMAYTVVFDKATVEFSTSHSPTVKVYTSGGRVETPTIEPGDGYHREIDYFLNCIVKKTRPKVVTPRDARNAVYLVKAEEKSARDHRNVAVTM